MYGEKSDRLRLDVSIMLIPYIERPKGQPMLNKVRPAKALPTLTTDNHNQLNNNRRTKTATQNHHRVVEGGTRKGLRRQHAIVHKGG